MSKGLLPLKLGYAPQRHLPFVVVSSVSTQVRLANHARLVNLGKNRGSGQLGAPVLKRVFNITGAARHRKAVTSRRCPYV